MASVAEKVQKLRALVSLLQDASETIIADWRADSAATDSGKDSVWNSSVPSPALYEARRVALGACGMYIDLVQDSATRLTEVASSYLPARALHIACRSKRRNTYCGSKPRGGHRVAKAVTTEANIAAVNLRDVVLDPGKTFSTSIRESAFNVTYGTDKPLFEYVELPMGGLGEAGGLSLQLAMRFPKLQFVVQDRPKMIQQAREAWEKDFPVALEEERVQFMAHDFFTEQTVREADVYVLRQILHDWPDDDCITILGHLRQAMRRDSCILVVDIIIHPSVGSSCLKDAPLPLLRNYGSAQLVGSTRDLAMLTLFNACERTPEHLSTLAVAAGLRLEKCRTKERWRKVDIRVLDCDQPVVWIWFHIDMNFEEEA
ncbi:predicted protein [Postia placenta Mad-698-R]|nr:predicted protein [Postia placenta Mad-698-R]